MLSGGGRSHAAALSPRDTGWRRAHRRSLPVGEVLRQEHVAADRARRLEDRGVPIRQLKARAAIAASMTSTVTSTTTNRVKDSTSAAACSWLSGSGRPPRGLDMELLERLHGQREVPAGEHLAGAHRLAVLAQRNAAPQILRFTVATTRRRRHAGASGPGGAAGASSCLHG